MERLTNRIIIPKEEQDIVVFTQGKYIDTIPAEMTYEDIRKVLRRLAEYEEAEEQGLLLRSPIKVGDTVYVLCKNIVTEKQVYDVQYRGGITYQKGQRWYVNIGGVAYYEMDFGKTVFLTQEEAEQKLKEKEMGIRPLYSNYSTKRIIERLTEYEEAEEQGLMVRLPVPIGTTVYEFEPLNKIVKGCTERTVIKYMMYDDSIWFSFADGYMKDIKDFGKTIFLTREAAEQKLKEYEK